MTVDGTGGHRLSLKIELHPYRTGLDQGEVVMGPWFAAAALAFAFAANAHSLPVPDLHDVVKQDSASEALLRWAGVEGATRYHVMVVSYRYFPNVSTPVESTWVNDSALTDTNLIVKGLAVSQYKWTARAGSAEGWGPFANARNFQVYRETEPAPLTDLVVPELLSPYDGEIRASTTIDLVWTQTMPGGDRYQYRLLRLGQIPETASEAVVVNASKATVSGLIPGSEYAWQVRIGDGTHWAPYSASRRFRIAVDSQPQLIFPRPDESLKAADKIVFQWREDPFASRYFFKLRLVRPVDSILSAVDIGNPGITIVMPDRVGEYEWYVCSIREGLQGACTPTARFRTESGVTPPDSLALRAAARLQWVPLAPGTNWTYDFTYRVLDQVNWQTLVTTNEKSVVTVEIRNRSVSGDSIFLEAGVNVRATDGRQRETMREEKYLVLDSSLYAWQPGASPPRWISTLYYSSSTHTYGRDAEFPASSIFFRPPEWDAATALKWVKWGAAQELQLDVASRCRSSCGLFIVGPYESSRIRGLGLTHWKSAYYAGGSLGSTYESEYVLTSMNGVRFDTSDVFAIVPPSAVAPQAAAARIPPGDGSLQARLDAVPGWTSASFYTLGGTRLAELRPGMAPEALRLPKGVALVRVLARSRRHAFLWVNP